MNHEQILDRIRREYEPYSEFAIAELQQVDYLRAEWERTKDPEWMAFRDNPKTIALYKHAANVFRGAKMQMANDDGKMLQEERMKLHVSCLWAQWWMQALGGDPDKVRAQVESEILRFAETAGIKE